MLAALVGERIVVLGLGNGRSKRSKRSKKKKKKWLTVVVGVVGSRICCCCS